MDLNEVLKRIGIIIIVAIVSHMIVLAIRFIQKKLIKRKGSLGVDTKWLSIGSLMASILVFIIYFVAVGKILVEIGVSLTTYFASASVIGLAVAFGSQGIVQDVVTGITVVFSDLLDIGDLVEIGGKTGYVEYIGMRFVIIHDANKAKIYIPNRTISSVVNYRHKSLRYYVDVQIPQDENIKSKIFKVIEEKIQDYAHRYPSFFIHDTIIRDDLSTPAGAKYIRIIFKMWPSRYSIIESNFKQELLKNIQAIDSSYPDWMIISAPEVEKGEE